MASSEEILWEGTPSQLINVGSWIFGGFTLFILPVVRTIRVKTTKYRVSSERVVKTHGILSKRTENLEFYRVRDFTVDQPFFLRIFGKVNVTLASADMTHPTFMLQAVPKIPALTDSLRDHIERVRESRGVRLEESF